MSPSLHQGELVSTDIFTNIVPDVRDNDSLRIPQREGFAELEAWADARGAEREVGLVLPVGCGKSGLIAIAPFAVRAHRVLVVAPGLRIASQLERDLDRTQGPTFYERCAVLPHGTNPEPVPIRGTLTNRADLEEADVVVTNIQQLQGEENRWLGGLPCDFFDAILFDEGHHNVAASWDLLRGAFPEAAILNFSATPVRADGQHMSGRIIYSFPIFRAIEAGYVKRLRGLVLNPRTLRYVRREDGHEVEVDLDEVRRLGEENADFRRSIVTSNETLTTIVDASIGELRRQRQETGDRRHKIIASALNYHHCIQIVEAYEARGLHAAYVHSQEDGLTNARTYERLDNHELDVIVQVRMLGEGFDHPYLSVAAVFSIFAQLSPFVQFVGRIMRVVDQNDAHSMNNRGTVVFHAGANVASRWTDFQAYSQADQDFFDQLLPLEGLDFADAEEIMVEPTQGGAGEQRLEVREQTDVMLQEIPLLDEDEEAQAAFELLRERGLTPEDYSRALEQVPTVRWRERSAARAALDSRVRTDTTQMLRQRAYNPMGYDLDVRRLQRTNFVIVKSAIDRRIAELNSPSG
ncbi:MAG: DEAD/DEAH box helicase family protein [Armatimonadetes bacterium]|nr:DEAD/DEAH box helicase family protein [Armatimonadota bacterium]